jgi:RNA methyltransferase, TrmH family
VEVLQGGVMKNELCITSLQNPKIKNALKLKDRSHRDDTGFFLIEGYRELKRAADAGIAFHSLFICPDLFLGVNEPALISQIRELTPEIHTCSDKVFEKLSYRDRSDGLVGIAYQMKRELKDVIPYIIESKNPFILLAEGIEKPGNLGSILRSADAVKVDGVIVCDRCTDIYNPNVVRASVGTLFTIPVVEAKGSETLLWLREKKIQVVAATPSAKKEYTEVDLSGPIALAVGSEQLGLSDPWLKACDVQVRIPMLGVADSLNVATAATLLLYEVIRQRKGRYAPPGRFF